MRQNFFIGDKVTIARNKAIPVHYSLPPDGIYEVVNVRPNVVVCEDVDSFHFGRQLPSVDIHGHHQTITLKSVSHPISGAFLSYVLPGT